MMMNLLLFALSLLLAKLGYYILDKLSKIDDDLLFYVRLRDMIILAVFLFVTSLILLYKNQPQVTAQLIYILILFWYLYLVAWIDFYTMKVYRISSILFCLIGLINFICYVPSYERILGLIFYIVFLMVLSVKNMFGRGDIGIFISTSLILACLNYNEFTITILLLHNVLSTLVFIVVNRKHIHIKKIKMKKEIAFAPSIVIAAWIMTIIYF